VLRFKVPDLGGVLCGCTEPVAVGREAERVDDGARIERVQPLALNQVPEKSVAALATRCAQRTVRAHRDGIDVSSVAAENGAELAVREVPHLDVAVPGAGDNHRLEGVGREADTGDPSGVALASAVVTADGVLALTECVPELDGAVAGGGDNLTVVRGEGDGEDVLLVADESAGGDAGGERSHRRSSPSQDPDSANWPSELRTTSWTKWEWPVRRRNGTP
jgi:hypothetical protein